MLSYFCQGAAAVLAVASGFVRAPGLFCMVSILVVCVLCKLEGPRQCISRATHSGRMPRRISQEGRYGQRGSVVGNGFCEGERRIRWIADDPKAADGSGECFDERATHPLELGWVGGGATLWKIRLVEGCRRTADGSAWDASPVRVWFWWRGVIQPPLGLGNRGRGGWGRRRSRCGPGRAIAVSL
jgi:hypothetical protein